MLLGILLAAVIVVCIALVGVILLQRSEGGVLGMSGGGGPGNFMSARGTGDLLTTTTQILAGVFFALCLIMTLVTGHIRRENALASSLKNLSITPGAPASSAPAQTSAAQAAMTPGAAAPASGAAPAPVRAPSNDGLNLFGNAPQPGVRVPAQPKPVAVQPPPAPAAPSPAPTAAKPTAAAKPAPAPKPVPVAKKPATSSAKPASSAPAAPAPTAEPAPAPAAPAPAASSAPANN